VIPAFRLIVVIRAQAVTVRNSWKSTSNDRFYSSFAFIVIFAFSTFDTGQPFSAASAYF
jgi:hypothetical protein